MSTSILLLNERISYSLGLLQAVQKRECLYSHYVMTCALRTQHINSTKIMSTGGYRWYYSAMSHHDVVSICVIRVTSPFKIVNHPKTHKEFCNFDFVNAYDQIKHCYMLCRTFEDFMTHCSFSSFIDQNQRQVENLHTGPRRPKSKSVFQ